MTPNALRSLWKQHPWGVGEVLYYLNAEMQGGNNLWRRISPNRTSIFSSLLRSPQKETEPNFFCRASHGKCTEWSSVQRDRPRCSPDSAEGFALQSTDLSTTLSSGHSTSLTWLLLLLPKPLGSRQGTRDPPWFTSHFWTTFCSVPQLLSGAAAKQIYPTCCSQDCTVMRAKQALPFRDVCMLRTV